MYNGSNGAIKIQRSCLNKRGYQSKKALEKEPLEPIA